MLRKLTSIAAFSSGVRPDSPSVLIIGKTSSPESFLRNSIFVDRQYYEDFGCEATTLVKRRLIALIRP